MNWLARIWNRLPPLPEGPGVLRLRPQAGYGDHLMLSAVIEGIKAERPELRIFLVAKYPELFRHNPRVEEALKETTVARLDPARLEKYHRTKGRPPEARYMQTTGHLIDDLYASVGVPVTERPRQPAIYLTAAEEQWQAARLERLPRPRVAIVPNGKRRVRLPNKIYPADQWAELGNRLVAEAGTVLQLGSSQDGPLVEGARDYRDIGYRKTAAVLKRCDLLVTHVGGIMHLAAAVRVPAVVLYGATEHPGVSGYPTNRNLYVPIECGPCWMESPCSHLSCMKQLTPELALTEIRAALAHLRAGARDLRALPASEPFPSLVGEPS